MVIIRMPSDYDLSNFGQQPNKITSLWPPLINQWISIEETIEYRTSGAYSIILRYRLKKKFCFLIPMTQKSTGDQKQNLCAQNGGYTEISCIRKR